MQEYRQTIPQIEEPPGSPAHEFTNTKIQITN